MKILIGKRDKIPDPSFRGAVSLVALFMGGQAYTTKRVQPGNCKWCGKPVETILTENTKTGEVWLEAPSNCPKCKRRLVAKPLPSFPPLSQEAINQLFGKF